MKLTPNQIEKLKEVGYTDEELEKVNELSDEDVDSLVDHKKKLNTREAKVKESETKHNKTREEIEKTPGGYVILQKNSIHQKFINSNVAMMASGNLPYYGEFNQYINFHEAKIGTCGVNVSEKGMNFFWDPKFVDSLTQEETNFVVIHEDCHLLFDHIKRSVGYDKKISNIVQDMIINQTIYDEIMSKPNLKEFIEIPKDVDDKNTTLFIPKEYPGMYAFEELYEWFVKKYREHRQNKFNQTQNQCPQCGQSMPNDKQKGKGKEKQDNNGQPQSGQGQEQGEGQSQPGDGKCPHCGQDKKDGEGQGQGQGQGQKGQRPGYGKNGKSDVECGSLEDMFDALDRGEELTLDVHLDDGIPEELRKEIVGDIVNKMKARGLETGDMTSILNKLRKSKKDYLKDIKRAIANDIFGTTKNKTITRPNRKSIWGLKGQKKYKNCINVVLDTSGSMGGSFEKVLSYVFQNNIHLNLIQIDTQVNSFQVVKSKKELERVKIAGLGGTVISPALKFIADPKNGLNKYNVVVLTDGYTDSLDFTGVKGKTLILTTAEPCPIAVDNGRVKQIKVEKDE